MDKGEKMVIERRGDGARCLRWQIAVLWKFFAVESTPNALNNIPRRMAHEFRGLKQASPPLSRELAR